MKPSKLFLIAITIGALAASSAIARPASVRTHSPSRSFSVARPSATHWVGNSSNWRHRHHRHSSIYFAFGYPFGYGYPYYYGYYPYRYGYYAGPDEVVYQAVVADRSTVVAVQRRLARTGHYHGAIDGVIGYGTRNAIRSYERAHGLRMDGQIDRRLLATMGLA